MTFREKLASEHPEKIKPEAMGACLGCPHEYGYEFKTDGPCSEKYEYSCYECWNREIPGTEPTKKNLADTATLTDLINRVATKKDISISIFIRGDATSISIYPHPDPADGTKNPTAEAYKSLLAGDTVGALEYLGEALAE